MKPKITTSNKKTHQKNKKSRSVTIQTPEETRSAKRQIPKSAKQYIPKPKSRSGDEALTPQRLASVAAYPKNRLYIHRGASIHILFNKE